MKQILTVSGMSCVNCAKRIENNVAQLATVKTATVNFATEKVYIDYYDTIDEQTVVQTIETMGYHVIYDDGDQKRVEQRFVNRVKWSALLTTLLMYIAMGHMLHLPLPSLLHQPFYAAFVQLVITVPIIWINRAYYGNGFQALIEKQPNMDTLVAIGTIASFLQGVYAVIQLMGGAHLPVYFESGAVILTLVTIGKWLEKRSKQQTQFAINALLNLTPQTAFVQKDGEWVETFVDLIEKNAIVTCKTGDRIALDGIVIHGQALVDESMLTGESNGVLKTIDTTVIGGSVVLDGFVTYKVTHVGQQTTIAQMIRLVEEAQQSKMRLTQFVDRISRVFVPVVLVLATITFAYWYYMNGSISVALNHMIAVLIIACPCALGLATPTAVMVGTGKGAQKGILIKNGEALEQLNQIDTIVFDKTGTLTTGNPVVTNVMTTIDESLLWRYVCALEQHVNHPIAKALMVHQKGTFLPVENFRVVAGGGIEGIVNGVTVRIGNESFIADEQWLTHLNHFTEQGKTSVLVSVDNCVVAVIALWDDLKADSVAVVKQLRQKGVDVVLLTGDNERVARAVAKQLRIETVYAHVLPEDKVRVVERLQQSGKVVAMVGDGINDAPTLSKAHVGIAIGTGTQVAIQSADVVLMGTQLTGLLTAIQLSRQTIQTIRQNLFWAFIYNVICLPVAMGLFEPVMRLNPMLAGLAMGLSSLCVIANALRLQWKK